MFMAVVQSPRFIITVAGLVGLAVIFYRLVRPALGRIRWMRKKEAVWNLVSFILGVSLSIASFLAVSSFYVYYGFGHQPDIYRHGDRKLPMVAITFDDGPSPDFTPKILDTLRDYEVPATFFMVGSHVDKYPEIAKRIVEEGHEIGNHTYNHRNVPTLTSFDLNEEIIGATTAITQVTGQYPEYVRPPRGMYDGRFRRLSALMGQKIVLWTVSSRDWRYGTTADKIVKNVMSRVKNGDIILFHDSGALVRNEGGDRSATVKALPVVIEQLWERGFQIVPLRVLLMDEEPEEEFPSVDMQE